MLDEKSKGVDEIIFPSIESLEWQDEWFGNLVEKNNKVLADKEGIGNEVRVKHCPLISQKV